jgi:hypothetical protein
MGVFGLMRRVLGRAKEPSLLYKVSDGRVAFVGYGFFIQEIAGESHYQSELGKIAGPKTDAGANHEAIAHLVPEPTNKFDRRAIRVEIDGMTVGYIPKDDFDLFNGVLKGRTGVVKARINGGWDRGKRGSALFGVELDVAYEGMEAVKP